MIDQKFIQTKLTHQMRKAECSGNPAITNNKCINSTLADYKAYGNSEQDDCGENLLNLAMTPTTISGITCTKLDSGFYQFTGTSTAEATFRSVNVYSNRKLFKAGTYYIPYPIPANVRLGLNFTTESNGGSLKQAQISTGNRKFTLTNDYYLSQWWIYCYTTDTAYDFSFFPQITKEDITEHKAYVSAPTPDTPSEIRSVGDKSKNILPYPYAYSSSSRDGITITDNGDGTLTFNGTTTNRCYFYFVSDSTKLPLTTGTYTPKKYVLSGTISSPSGMYYQVPHSNGTSTVYSTSTFTLENDTLVRVRLDIDQKGEGITFNNYRVGFVLVKGDTAPEQYQPYNKYEIPIKVKSKNLFNINETQLDNPKGTYYQPIVTVDGTTLKLQARNANAIQCAYFHCDVGKGRKVTLRVSGLMGANAATSNSRVRYSFTDDVTNIGGGEVIGSHLSSATFSQSETKTYSVTVTSTARYMLICMGVQLTGSDLSNAIAYYSNIQVEYGDSVTDYEEYKEPETRSIYLNEPLRAIGEYKDYIDFRQGKVIRSITALTLKAEQLTYLSTHWYSTKNIYAIGFNKSKIGMLLSMNTKITLCMMEHYPDLYANPNRAGFTSSQNEGYVFIFRTDFDGTLAQAQELVAGENIIYVLATPTEETIDLPKLPQFKGTTVYTIDTDTNGEFWCKYKYKN